MYDLKNCPFCGGRARLNANLRDFDTALYNAFVVCEGCEARGSKVQDNSEHDGSFIFKAIENWNKRSEVYRDKGEWIGAGVPFHWKCSKCKNEMSMLHLPNFCPDCGVEMMNSEDRMMNSKNKKEKSKND